MPKEIRRLPIKKEDLPKKRDPFHKILSAKAGASGRLTSEDDYYQRHQVKTAARQDIEQQLADQLNDTEKELALKNILAEIEQWAGEGGLELRVMVKKADLQGKARGYLAALKDELADAYYQQADRAVVQQKEMILNWIQFLKKLLSQ